MHITAWSDSESKVQISNIWSIKRFDGFEEFWGILWSCLHCLRLILSWVRHHSSSHCISLILDGDYITPDSELASVIHHCIWPPPVTVYISVLRLLSLTVACTSRNKVYQPQPQRSHHMATVHTANSAGQHAPNVTWSQATLFFIWNYMWVSKCTHICLDSFHLLVVNLCMVTYIVYGNATTSSWKMQCG